MDPVAVEAVVHGLCYLHELGDRLVGHGDVDGGEGFFLVEAPDVEFVD